MKKIYFVCFVLTIISSSVFYSCSGKRTDLDPEEILTPEEKQDQELINRYGLPEGSRHVTPFSLKDNSRLNIQLSPDKHDYTVVSASLNDKFYVGVFDEKRQKIAQTFTNSVGNKNPVLDSRLVLYQVSDLKDSLYASFAVVDDSQPKFTTSVFFHTRAKDAKVLFQDLNSNGTAVPYEIMPWFGDFIAVLSPLNYQGTDAVNQILNKDFEPVLTGFARPDTSIFNTNSLISNSEAVKLEISRSSLDVYHYYLFPKQKFDVPWEEMVSIENWYVNYLDYPNEITFERIEDSSIEHRMSGRTLIINLHISGWIKPAFVNEEPNDQFFEQEINKEISVNLDSKKVIAIQNLNE